jgi:hypothetical protein
MKKTLSKQAIYLAAAKAAITAAGSNNGVKDSDINAMFRPLGFVDIEFETISPLFLDWMNQFGKRRGDVAHQSAHGVNYTITRQGEEKQLNTIIRCLQKFDQLCIRKKLHGLDN